MTAYPRITDLVFGRPLVMEPAALDAKLSTMGPRLLRGERLVWDDDGDAGEAVPRLAAYASLVEADVVPVAGGAAEFALTDEGVAIVPITGSLTNRFDYMDAVCGFTSYDAIGAICDALAADTRVKAVLFDGDTPGGLYTGSMDAGRKVIALSGIKTVWACANGMMTSGGLMVMGGARRVLAIQGGLVGSIGCVKIHLDQTAADQKAGFKYTAFKAGEHKTDGWSHEAMAEDVARGFMAEVESIRQAFAGLVGQQGHITTAQALATEAQTYLDYDAKAVGLVNDVQSFQETLAEITDVAAGRRAVGVVTAKVTNTASMKGNTTMAGTPQPAAPNPAPAPRVDGGPDDDSDLCPHCGQPMPDGDKAKAQAAAHAAAVTTAASNATSAAVEVMELCTLAGQASKAAGYVRTATPLSVIRAELAAAQVQAGNQPINTAPPTGPTPAKVESADDIYQRRAAQAAGRNRE
ncbi:S49 family peptidase [Nitrospirillum bahiense]|uniref:Protein C n=1 Tax=Nitrospirillum amazonense TaxID=28077 RepID=A0A560F1V3_9PROT|nr:S49 family peptidase [Nitrospirillum amazonense]TWB15603.1 protein C [Nitrospirillum amazonense]